LRRAGDGSCVASALPGDQFTTEVIEDALAALSDHGITLIEAEERTTFEATRHPARHEEPANDR
jgi:hypothetical protein